MAKNVSIQEDSSLQSKSKINAEKPLAVIEKPIYRKSICASYLTRVFKCDDDFAHYVSNDSYRVIGAESDGYDTKTLYGFSSAYVAYSTFRGKNIIVLKASLENELPGRQIYKFLSADECCDYPIYIEHNGDIIPIISFFPEENNLFLYVGANKEDKPVRLFANYLIRIDRNYYKYGNNSDYYYCHSFESANRLLLEQYNFFKNSFASDVIPDETSNKWSGEDDRLNYVHIQIVDLFENKLGHLSDGMV